MPTYTYDLYGFGELHKDAYGFRPSELYYTWMQTATPNELQAEWDRLIKAAELAIEEDKRRQKEAVESFEALVQKTIDAGAGDRQTALRWIMDRSNCNGDWDLLCYEYGLPYNYFKKMA